MRTGIWKMVIAALIVGAGSPCLAEEPAFTAMLDVKSKTASLSGLVPKACVKDLKVKAVSGRTKPGTLTFVIWDVTGKGESCLREKQKACGELECVTLADLSQDAVTQASFQTEVHVAASDVSKVKVDFTLVHGSPETEAVAVSADCNCEIPTIPGPQESVNRNLNTGELKKILAMAQDSSDDESEPPRPVRKSEPSRSREREAARERDDDDDEVELRDPFAKGATDSDRREYYRARAKARRVAKQQSSVGSSQGMSAMMAGGQMGGGFDFTSSLLGGYGSSYGQLGGSLGSYGQSLGYSPLASYGQMSGMGQMSGWNQMGYGGLSSGIGAGQYASWPYSTTSYLPSMLSSSMGTGNYGGNLGYSMGTGLPYSVLPSSSYNMLYPTMGYSGYSSLMGTSYQGF